MVKSSALGVRVFANASAGFALANIGGGNGGTYPAASRNGGKSWQIDGPPFWVPAADAPAVVTQVGVANSKTFFAWGGPGSGGEVVDVTSDAGAHWYGAALAGAELEAVVAGPKGELIAFTQTLPGSSSKAVTWVYVTADGGRHWQFSTSLAGGV